MSTDRYSRRDSTTDTLSQQYQDTPSFRRLTIRSVYSSYKYIPCMILIDIFIEIYVPVVNVCYLIWRTSSVKRRLLPPCEYLDLNLKILTGSKNLIGQYTHENTAKWARIVKLFEKDSTFLADSAKHIIQNVKYDIPLFKKQIARFVATKYFERLVMNCVPELMAEEVEG